MASKTYLIDFLHDLLTANVTWRSQITARTDLAFRHEYRHSHQPIWLFLLYSNFTLLYSFLAVVVAYNLGNVLLFTFASIPMAIIIGLEIDAWLYALTSHESKESLQTSTDTNEITRLHQIMKSSKVEVPFMTYTEFNSRMTERDIERNNLWSNKVYRFRRAIADQEIELPDASIWDILLK